MNRQGFKENPKCSIGPSLKPVIIGGDAGSGPANMQGRTTNGASSISLLPTMEIRILLFGEFVNIYNKISGDCFVSVQIWGIEKAAVGATTRVALLADPDIGGTPARRPLAGFANPDIGGKPPGRPQGSPLRLCLRYPLSERLPRSDRFARTADPWYNITLNTNRRWHFGLRPGPFT